MAANPLKEEQVGKACASLLKYIEGREAAKTDKKEALFSEDEYVLLVVGLTKIPPSGRNKPFRIKIPHPVYNREECDVCYFVKDTAATKKKLKANPVPCIKEVVSLEKLRTDYKDFESKRKLCGSFDMFLCEARILPMMPKAIGKKFFLKKKQPIHISSQPKDLGPQVRRALESTYFFQGTGSCSVVRIGTTTMDADEISANIMKAMDKIVTHIPKEWRGVKSLHIKTSASVALPIYNKYPDAENDAVVKEGSKPAKGVKAAKLSTTSAKGKVSKSKRKATAVSARPARGKGGKKKKRR